MSVSLADAERSAASGVTPTTIPVSAVEQAGLWCGMLLLFAMLVLVGTEVVSRNLFGLSWDGTDEFGGYMLVALTFASMPVCLARGGLHEMQMVRGRLGPGGRAALDLLLHVASFVFTAVLVWQYTRLTLSSWRMGDVSMTEVQTPLWAPRATMALGSLALCFTLLRLVGGDLRQLARAAGR